MFDLNRITRLTGSLLVAMLLSLSLASAASAQDETPRELPLVPDPGLCTVEPIAGDDLTAVVGTPAAATPPVSESAADPDAGEEADEETVGQVTATVIEAAACTNGQEFFRLFALFSDNALQSLTGNTVLDADVLADLETIASTPIAREEWVEIIDIRNVRTQDGRVSAVVESKSGSEPAGVDLWYFVEQDGRYLVDETINDVEPAASTPTA